MENLTLDDMIALICNADSLAEALKTYLTFASELQGYRIVLASPKGSITGFAANRDFAHGAAVRSLFNSERVLVLDYVTVNDMLRTGKTEYPFDYSISLDTQALSHLLPYVSGRDPAKIDRDLQEVFEFIARDDVYVDPLPYQAENIDNLNKGQQATDAIFERLKAYEILRTLDRGRFLETGNAYSLLPESEIGKRAQETISRMLYDREDRSFMDELRFHHSFEYVHLLKMTSIAFRYPKATLDEKIERFAEFGDQTLATMGGREIILARAYFERGQKMGFFSRVQKKKPDIFSILRNMAWDLCHSRRMELGLTLRPHNSARYFYPALLTFDRNLVEVLNLYPLKACAFMEGSSLPMPFYAGDWKKVIATTPEGSATFFSRFYSNGAIQSRAARRNRIREDIGSIVADMETELAGVAEI